MRERGIRFLAMVLLVWIISAASALSEDAAESEAEPQVSKPLVLKARAAYLYNMTGKIQIRFKDGVTAAELSKGAGKTRLQSGSRLQVIEGKAVILAGPLRIYLEKGDAVDSIIDYMVVRACIEVPAGYPRGITLRDGIVKEKVEASRTYFAPSK